MAEPVVSLVIAHLGMRVFVPFRAELPAPATVCQILALAAMIILAAGVLMDRICESNRWTRVALAFVIVAGLSARGVIILIDIDPPFDVPLIQEAAAAALRSGSDPYLTHVYDGGYPYLPVSAVAALLGTFAGDARYAVSVGDALTALGIIVAARRWSALPRLGEATAALGMVGRRVVCRMAGIP